MMQLLVVLLSAWACAVPAAASKRLAFIVGISNYGKSNGLDKLKAPANDAEAVKTALEALRVRFDAVIYTDKDLPDKAAFDKAFEQFLNKIEAAGDEVLFYFSGHGNYVPGQGNVFLLPDGKSEAAFLKGLSVADARALDTNDRKTQRYQEWLSNVAIREQDIEKAIAGKKPNVTILIADACRSLVKGTKGASLEVGGVRLPQHTPRGTFRLYSAGIGQFSLDSVEPIFRVEKASLAKAPVKPKNDDDGDDENSGKKSSVATNSLFTKILLGVLLTPGLEFTVMAAQVRIAVRRHADTLGQVQIPDYSGDPLNNEFYFSPVQQSDQVEQICSGVEVELERLRLAVAAGSIGRDVLLSKKYELAPAAAP